MKYSASQPAVTTAGSSLVNPMYLFRGDVPIKEFAGAFKPPLRWGIRMTGTKFLREYPYREAYLLRDAKLFRAELSMPLILLGGITNRQTMDLAMAEGFDFVAMGRALLEAGVERETVMEWTRDPQVQLELQPARNDQCTAVCRYVCEF